MSIILILVYLEFQLKWCLIWKKISITFDNSVTGWPELLRSKKCHERLFSQIIWKTSGKKMNECNNLREAVFPNLCQCCYYGILKFFWIGYLYIQVLDEIKIWWLWKTHFFNQSTTIFYLWHGVLPSWTWPPKVGAL